MSGSFNAKNGKLVDWKSKEHRKCTAYHATASYQYFYDQQMSNGSSFFKKVVVAGNEQENTITVYSQVKDIELTYFVPYSQSEAIKYLYYRYAFDKEQPKVIEEVLP